VRGGCWSFVFPFCMAAKSRTGSLTAPASALAVMTLSFVWNGTSPVAPMLAEGVPLLEPGAELGSMDFMLWADLFLNLNMDKIVQGSIARLPGDQEEEARWGREYWGRTESRLER
jgi:hypothetical protein